MSWRDDELDDLVRDASKQVPNPVYQDNFFDEITHLLPKKKQNKWWLLAFLPALFVPFLYVNVDQTNLNSAYFLSSKLNLKKTIYSSSSLKNVSLGELKEDIKEKERGIDVRHNIQINRDELVDVLEIESSTDEFKNQFDAPKMIGNHLTFKGTVLVETAQYSALSTRLLNYKSKTKYLTINSQVGLSSSWIKETNTKPAFVIDFGAAYQRQFTSLNVELGINFSALIPHEMSFEKNAKVYGVKINRYEQKLTYHAIYALDLPLQISKSFNRNALSLSVSPQYFIGGTVAVSQIQNSQKLNEELYIGTNHGLSNFGLKGAIAYQYKISDSYEFGIKITAQLINPIQEGVLETSKNNFPMMGQLTLKKYIKLR